MLLVIIAWVLAIIAGLSWARVWTGACTVATLILFIWVKDDVLTNWMTWLQLGILGATPWLLAGQRERHEQRVAALHREEAAQTAKLAEAARALMSLESSAQQMDEQIAQITDLYRVTKETARTLHLNELFTALVEILPRLLDLRGVRLITELPDGAPVALRAARAADGQMALAEATRLAEFEAAILERAASSKQGGVASVQELGGSLPDGLSRVAWAPLWRKQQVTGVLIAEELPEPQLKTLPMIAQQLSLQLSRIHLYAQVEALAVTDTLTGVFVRGYFLQRAREELARSKRHRLTCTLIMADLDLFKQKNDTYGHLVGDVVLREVARLLQRNLRDIDLIARYGGEEFILLLIETDLEQALPITQRLKQLVELHSIRAYDELLTQTISMGLATFPRHGETVEALIERADAALYAAKHAGRNRVVPWSPSVASVQPA